MVNILQPQSAPRKFSTLAFVFLVVIIPLAVFAVISSESFNPKEKAGNLVDTESCLISFPYINPSSIGVDKKVQVQVNAKTEGEAIRQVMIMGKSGEEIFKRDFDDGRDTISETFVFQPTQLGDFGMLGTLTTDKTTRPCVVAQKREVVVVASNTAPEVKTLPPVGTLKVKGTYQYQLEAIDEDGDTINFAFSFTPEAKWLKSSVIENGTDGKLTIKFSGIPDKPGSYLANLFIHDGYNAHLRAQTWIISVDQDENDIPKVTITSPATETKIEKGQKITVGWDISDLNEITKHELYISSNPGNSSTWISLAKNLGPRVASYIFDSTDMPVGTYQFVLKAYDSFNPPAYGTGVSPKVTIGEAKPETDDGPVISDPQITNITPGNEIDIQNRSTSISATLIPSEGATIDKESIKIVLNDTDITSKSTITSLSESQYSVTYAPESEHDIGTHKVTISFTDSNKKLAERSWTFNIVQAQSDTDMVSIFGYKIPQRLLLIIAGGITAVLFAIIVPWLLYLVWKGSRKSPYEEIEIYEKTTPPPPPTYTAPKEEPVVPPPPPPVENKVQVPQFTISKPEIKSEEIPIEEVTEDVFEEETQKELEDITNRIKEKEEAVKNLITPTPPQSEQS